MADCNPSHDGSSESEAEIESLPPKKKRSPAAKRKRNDEVLDETTQIQSCVKKLRRTPSSGKKDIAASVTDTIEGVLAAWSMTTEYGLSFRGMTPEEQTAEVVVLNKGAVKGMKGIIKSKLLMTHYKTMVAEKLRAHIAECRVMPAAMFHSSPKNLNLVTSNLKFLSVGEWVEVDADRSPGYNSEGGIAFIVSVHDDMADVK